MNYQPWDQLRLHVENYELIGLPDHDPMPNGSVVRWTLGGQYTYAAIRAAGRWYTTAAREPTILTYAQLVETLASPDVTAVTVASFPKSRSIK